ncbi:SDR family oxidoreductase [Chitinophaga sancti]|uniref:SDR family oxidoreductase n=1 Tax=Chitinophaga sancti TaxID=1004 RepID=A0A1K1SY68_9BACT|nr:SDR family oxidoreductase [Chitinophaga sancti]WQD62290.1 SDR family oxidoreductase [Chitinophaga sancti]WQG92141.1 SDR family oxidoreductase [Chitinophaga sancti]SFW89007.1 Uncharacterized conserved protein YbjT, contains NAD(P)-binding and DUF2867 domains [Chitinophaga sancti]
MRILLTGATGYIAQRLLPVLLGQGHQVVCVVRDLSRFDLGKFQHPHSLSAVEVDLLDKDAERKLPADIDIAFYLVHSLNVSGKFESLEEKVAQNFVKYVNQSQVKQVIYLGGITNADKLSRHLSSRNHVEQILGSANKPLTTLRAGIIVGSGSSSFEIIRDLVEKLPVMIAPRWLKTKTQPIAIRNVIEFLTAVMADEYCYGKSFDIYGPDILTYKQMLLSFAEVRKFKRSIITLPVMTPRLSSYWLYFVTSTSYTLAQNLVESMKVDVVARENSLSQRYKIHLMSYKEAIHIAFDKIEQNLVLSTWNDALGFSGKKRRNSKLIQVPKYGVFNDKKCRKTANQDLALERIFSIGGLTGWYYANWLWEFRGLLDKLFGGVGLKRGRKNPTLLNVGDHVDFWRVIYASKKERRLLLYAEMKLPGEAWLEFRIEDGVVWQTATFRPHGLAGRLYWYAVLPFHYFIFNGMINKIAV